MSAEEEKAKGNAAMGQKNYADAVKHILLPLRWTPKITYFTVTALLLT